MKIFAVVPIYNEKQERVTSVLKDLEKFVDEIIVVDDGSIESIKVSEYQSVRVLKHRLNRGQGAALETGTEYALEQGADAIVHFDGDGQFVAEEIKAMIEPVIKGEVDITLGTRFFKDSDSKIPFLKRVIILPVAKIINYLFTGLKLTDAHCGFRAMNRKAAEFLKVEQDRMSHATEIVAKIKKNNLRYKEMPVTVIYHQFGQGVGGGIKIIRELLFSKFF